ncbi:MAG: hypothetical protein ABJB97_07015 [Acidobacteriota bacterium]
MTFQPFRSFLVLACSVACMCLATESLALEGKVIDGSTGRPLSGVYVIGAWVVSSGIGVVAKSGCGKLEVTRTDEQGRFTLSKWSESILAHLIGDENLNVYYYMRGYRWEKGHPQLGDTVVLIPDTRSALERLGYISETAGKADCGSIEQRKKKALPLYRVMYEEASSLASTTKDQRRVRSNILFMIEALELGYTQAEENSKTRFLLGYP